jgi:hypothetical protein
MCIFEIIIFGLAFSADCRCLASFPTRPLGLYVLEAQFFFWVVANRLGD